MNLPYAIIPIGILALVLYISSYLMAKIGVIRIASHRQIWNILLLVTFLVTACIGLVLAIQVNYKIKIPFTDELLIWHVDFGIGMAFIGIFHFLWHLDYYLKIFKSEKSFKETEDTVLTEFNKTDGRISEIKREDFLPIIALGMTTLITQVILLREFLTIFEGNELVIGTILANWMIITGLGAYFGKTVSRINFSVRFVFNALVFSGFIPIILVFLLNYLKNIIFPVGTMVGLSQIIFSSFILLMPFCLFTGFLFTYYAYNLSKQYHSNLISRVYAIEAAGSLAGGIIYSFILIYFLRSLQILVFVSLINFIFAAIYSGKKEKRNKKPILIFTVLILLILGAFVFKMDLRIKKFLFSNQEIVFMKDTPFGNLTITESAGQKNFYENNVLLFSTDNVMYAEETVHFPMLQCDSPEKILLIGGGITGLMPEIFKYPIEKIDYVEINPWIIRIGKHYTKTFIDERIRVINEDARHFLKKTDEKYDVIIVDMPPPASAQVNRYFTIEFFEEMKKKITENGVISLSLPSTENYISEKASQVQSIVFRSLKQVFKNVKIIPGEKNYFIASDKEPDLNIAQLYLKKGIDNVYVNQYYIDDDNLQRRSNYILQNIIVSGEINKDFKPIAYFMEIGYWASQFHSNYWFIGLTGLIIILFILLRLNIVKIGLFTTGFTSSSMEVLFIFAFQIIYGFVYHMVGVIITIFMAGLATGAFFRENIVKGKSTDSYWKVQISIALFALILPGILFLLQNMIFPNSIIYMIFALITLIISILTGIQFSLAAHIEKENIASVSGGLYSIDLLGSAFGAFLVSVFLFPILGLVKIFIFLAVINLISGVLSYNYRGSV